MFAYTSYMGVRLYDASMLDRPPVCLSSVSQLIIVLNFEIQIVFVRPRIQSAAAVTQSVAVWHTATHAQRRASAPQQRATGRRLGWLGRRLGAAGQRGDVGGCMRWQGAGGGLRGGGGDGERQRQATWRDGDFFRSRCGAAQ